jgi:hypothetical protein
VDKKIQHYREIRELYPKTQQTYQWDTTEELSDQEKVNRGMGHYIFDHKIKP